MDLDNVALDLPLGCFGLGSSRLGDPVAPDIHHLLVIEYASLKAASRSDKGLAPGAAGSLLGRLVILHRVKHFGGVAIRQVVVPAGVPLIAQARARFLARLVGLGNGGSCLAEKTRSTMSAGCWFPGERIQLLADLLALPGVRFKHCPIRFGRLEYVVDCLIFFLKDPGHAIPY